MKDDHAAQVLSNMNENFFDFFDFFDFAVINGELLVKGEEVWRVR
jgi:hypothetical protein